MNTTALIPDRRGPAARRIAAPGEASAALSVLTPDVRPAWYGPPALCPGGDGIDPHGRCRSGRRGAHRPHFWRRAARPKATRASPWPTNGPRCAIPAGSPPRTHRRERPVLPGPHDRGRAVMIRAFAAATSLGGILHDPATGATHRHPNNRPGTHHTGRLTLDEQLLPASAIGAERPMPVSVCWTLGTLPTPAPLPAAAVSAGVRAATGIASRGSSPTPVCSVSRSAAAIRYNLPACPS